MSASIPDNYDSYENYYGNYTNLAVSLLTHYSFDLGGYKANELIARWQVQFPLHWLHLAVVEALYQGRYKAISVEQILNIWLRRGQASFHFNMEFERLICSKFPQILTTPTSTSQQLPALPPVPQTNNYQNTYIQNSRTENNLSVELDKKDTNNQSNRNRTDSGNSYQGEKNNTMLDWTAVRRPPIPNIELVEHKSQSHVATQLVKMLPPATHHPAIEQFTPEKTKVSESFASKLKSIVRVESAEC
ncbi:hypothetical protein DSM106972_078390 [Dulcicalothrix desertica PCC 7102]|uniref:DnaD domain-containing protein n=2 Tax=Dulcicalothrix desertica TaxID=32056 RepID=A0A3S1CWB6_9CYAN|nr:hypothetical protein DSM106972_078390 [Dulcicalothrix desertica PCC 7102]